MTWFRRKSAALNLIRIIPVWHTCRTSAHVYIDIYSFDGASQMIFWFMVADAIGVLAVAFLRWRAERFGGESLPKAYTACAVAAFFLTVVFMIVDFVMLGIMGSESSPIAGRELAKLLPYALGYYAAIFFALFFPAVRGRKARGRWAFTSIWGFSHIIARRGMSRADITRYCI